MRARLLVTGATGFLGHYVVGELRRRGLSFVTAGRSGADLRFDLADAAAVRAALAAARPSCILHAGAMAAMGACEQAPARARAVNVGATEALVQSGARVVLTSTDLVFDGATAPYAAAAPPRPLSVYGRTKAEAEAIVLAGAGLVVRVPLLIGKSFDGKRGATDMIRAAGAPVTLFTNEHRTPQHAAEVAAILVELVAGDRAGIVHLGGPERLSRWDLALRFAAAAGVSLERCVPGTCHDPIRPRDTALVSDIPPRLGLDAALREC